MIQPFYKGQIMSDKLILELFGKKLQKIRLERGWSQEKLALAASLDRTYISSVERGQRNISIINIYKLAKALDAAPGSLLGDVGSCDERN